MSSKICVGVLYGGKSGEHDVSVTTAFSVIQAFDYDKYEIVPIYITRKGEWQTGALLTAPAADKQALISGADQEVVLSPGHTILTPIMGRNGNQVQTADNEDGQRAGAIHVVLPLLHGTYGEDGTVQGLLEMANIPYVGAGVLASAAGMDKITMKKLFGQAGLPQCVYRHFTRTEWSKNREELILEIEVSLGYPCFVKPANLGSSVGISKARNQNELLAAVEAAFQYDRKVIVEEFVEAREIEVGILGNDEPKASVCGEIVSSNEFYDYRAKYIDGKSAMIIPADIPDELSERVREMAVLAFKAIDGSGLSRVDFFLRSIDHAVLINEINTMPGFTPFSMYPLLWKESGLSYKQLLDELIRLALERHEEKQAIQYNF